MIAGISVCASSSVKCLVYCIKDRSSFSEDGLNNMAGHAWVFLQPANRIAVPIGSERNIDSQPVSFADKFASHRFGDSEQHLKFILVFCKPETIDHFFRP